MAALRELAAGRADLLAEVAGVGGAGRGARPPGRRAVPESRGRPGSDPRMAGGRAPPPRCRRAPAAPVTPVTCVSRVPPHDGGCISRVRSLSVSGDSDTGCSQITEQHSDRSARPGHPWPQEEPMTTARSAHGRSSAGVEGEEEHQPLFRTSPESRWITVMRCLLHVRCGKMPGSGMTRRPGEGA